MQFTKEYWQEAIKYLTDVRVMKSMEIAESIGTSPAYVTHLKTGFRGANLGFNIAMRLESLYKNEQSKEKRKKVN